MRRRSLTELASNPDLISGIYNYCDRWCERCPLTSRCLVYATEQVGHNGATENDDLRNEAFWHKLSSILDETQEMISEWARKAGLDLTQIPEEEPKSRKPRRQLVDNHPLARAGKKYATVRAIGSASLIRRLKSAINVRRMLIASKRNSSRMRAK